MSEVEPERAFVACSPVNGSEVPPFPSYVVVCSSCGSRVWISATIHPRVLTGELEPICLPCLPLIERFAGYDIEARIHPDQAQELAEVGILDYAQSLVERWNTLRENLK